MTDADLLDLGADALAELPELPPLDLDALAAADAERLAALLAAVADPPPLPELPEVARSEVAGDHVDIRRRRAGREIHTADRRRRIVELRVAGSTFDEIGHALAISGEAARKGYRAALAAVYADDAGEALALELDRCDAITRRWWPVMLADDDAAASVATKHLIATGRLRAELCGLIPAKVEAVARGIFVPDDGEVWRQLQEYRRRDAAERAAEAIDVTAEAPR